MKTSQYHKIRLGSSIHSKTLTSEEIARATGHAVNTIRTKIMQYKKARRRGDMSYTIADILKPKRGYAGVKFN